MPQPVARARRGLDDARTRHPRRPPDGRQYAANFGDAHPPLTPAAGADRGRALLLLLRRACIQACPTGIDIPSSSDASARTTCAARRARSSRRTSSAACARASARPKCCANRPACATRTRTSRSRSACCSAMPPITTSQAGRPALRARAAPTGKRVAVVGAGPAGLSCAHRARAARPRRHGVRREAEARRPQRIRPRDLQDGRRLRAEGDRLAARRSAASSCAAARRSASRLAARRPARADFDAVFLGFGLAGVNALGLADERRDRRARTRSTSSPRCARPTTTARCRSAAASS